MRVFVLSSVAEDVDGGVDGAAHRGAVGDAFACDVVSCAMVGRGTDDGEACGEVDAVFHSKGFERGKALVVIHGEDGVEVFVGMVAEEAVSGVRPKAEDVLAFQLFESGDDDVFFFCAKQSVVACVWVEGEDGDARVGDVEILVERLVKDAELLGDAVFCDVFSYLGDGEMGGGKGDAKVVVDHNHEGLGGVAGAVLEVFSVAGKVEVVALDGGFVDGRGDKDVEESFFVVAHGLFDGGESSLPALGRWLSEFYLHLIPFQAINEVQAAVDDVGGVQNGGEVGGEVHCLAVVGSYLGRAVDNRDTKLEHGRITENLEDCFVAYSVDVALSDGDDNLFVLHIYDVIFLFVLALLLFVSVRRAMRGCRVSLQVGG